MCCQATEKMSTIHGFRCYFHQRFLTWRLEISPLSLTDTCVSKQQYRALIDVYSSETTNETGEIVTTHKRREESDLSYCTMVTAERGIGKTREGADGGVTLREKRGKQGGRGTRWQCQFISFQVICSL